MSRDNSGFDESPCTVRHDGRAVGLWWREQLWGSGNVTDLLYRGLCARCEIAIGHSTRLGDLRDEFTLHLESGHRELDVTGFLTIALRAFPVIFGTGGEVLRHIFFVEGNGYRWSEHGGIIAVGDSEDWRERQTRRHASREEFLIPLSEELASVMRTEFEKQNASEDETIDNSVALAADWSLPEGASTEPNTLLLNVPEKVRPDWLTAVEWARELAIRP